ncbi:MAG: hypothetical protein UHM08_06810 [Bacteroidales bacterium]|nr:hypothetical protein [Bacteroidales bacterium]
MMDFYYVYEQIELWEQDLKHQEEILLSKDYVVSPEEESIKKVVSYLKSQSVYSKTLNENINLGLN